MGVVDYHSVHGLYDLVVAGVRNLAVMRLFSLRCRDSENGYLKWEWLWCEGGPIYIIQPADGWSIVDKLEKYLPTIYLAARRRDLIEFRSVDL